MTEIEQTHETDVNPANYTGTPQAAAAEATGKPTAVEVIDCDAIRKGNRIRAGGLLWPMPDDWGGGFVRIRPASITAVSSARDEHERNIRKMPKVKRKFKPAENLSGKPGSELNRFTVVMAIQEWVGGNPLRFEGKVHETASLDDESLRRLISQIWLPELDLNSDAPPEDELDLPFLLHMLEGLDEVSRVPAAEIAAVGKDFKLGLAGNTDYRG